MHSNNSVKTVPYSTATDPELRRLWDRLKRKLLAIGGKGVVWGGFDPHLDRLTTDGRLFQEPVYQSRMEIGSAHRNTAHLWGQDVPNTTLVAGYALGNDCLWRQHSWVVQKGKLVETTGPKTAYFGVELIEIDALTFWVAYLARYLSGDQIPQQYPQVLPVIQRCTEGGDGDLVIGTPAANAPEPLPIEDSPLSGGEADETPPSRAVEFNRVLSRLLPRKGPTKGKRPKANPVTRTQFAQQMLRAIRQKGEKAEIRYDEAQFLLECKPQAKKLLLRNAYSEYCAAAPDRRSRILRRWVDAWFISARPLPTHFESASPHLMPEVCARYSLMFQATEHEAIEHSVPFQVVAEHFGVRLVYDMPKSMQHVSQGDLDKWGRSFQESLHVALANLTKESQQPFESAGPGLWASPWQDSYDASRILLPEILCRNQVRGDLIAMAPSRDILLLTGSDDELGLERMAELGEMALQGPRGLLGLALRLVGDQWEPYFPPNGHPQHRRFRELWTRSIGSVYGRQKQLLTQSFAKSGNTTYVSEFMVMANQITGQMASLSVWCEGMELLLPKTDMVSMGSLSESGEAEGAFTATWERVREIAGHLMTRTDEYPERYLVKEFPSNEQLEELRKEMDVSQAPNNPSNVEDAKPPPTSE